MNIEELYAKIGADYKNTLTRFCSNEGLLSKYVKKFAEDSTYQNLRDAVEAENYDGIEMYAHTLKGVSANMGFTDLQEASARLVEHVRQDNKEGIPADFEQVKEEYKNIINEIQKTV